MNIFDLTFIGSGMSCVSVLIEMLAELCSGEASLAVALKIAVVERQPQLWTGLPYGKRSTVNCMTITTFGDFLTDKEQFEAFNGWLVEHRDEWQSEYLELGGDFARSWCSRNKDHIENGTLDSIPIPRYLFGKYKSEQLADLIRLAQSRGLIELSVIKGSASSVKKDGDFSVEITSEPGRKSCLQSRRLVVTTGHLPPRTLSQFSKLPENRVIRNLYDPDVNCNLSILRENLSRVEDPSRRNLLLIGSNSSSIELINLVRSEPSLRELVNEIVVFSPSGKFPMASAHRDVIPEYRELKALEEVDSPDPSLVIEAMMKEFSTHFSREVCMVCLAALFKQARSILSHLDDAEYSALLLKHGDEITRKLRRIAKQNLQAVNESLAEGWLSIFGGGLVALDQAEKENDSPITLRFWDTDGAERTLATPFHTVISCIGFESVGESSCPFLNSALEQGLCRINESGKGIEVNSRFEASEGFYVMGPLIAGNVNETVNFWHLENVSRIMQLAPKMGNRLLGAIAAPKL